MIGRDHADRNNVVGAGDHDVSCHGHDRIEVAGRQRVAQIADIVRKESLHQSEVGAERGFQVALSATDGFSKLLAAGLSFSFAFQTFVIVGGITRVIPLTGITLPFVSYGGSSVVANFLLVAGLLLISHRANRQEVGT